MSYLGNSPGVSSQRTTSSYTATSGQTTFTATGGYQLGYVDVYLNGTKLVASTDYTASNGTTIVLVSGANVGDSVDVVSYQPRGLSDGYLKSEADAKYELLASKGVANGYAGLDGSAKVPSSQLPSYVDDVLEAANLAALPATGTSGIIYVTLDTNKTYRWSGSAYVEVSAGPGTTDALTEGSTNLYYTDTRARASISATSASGVSYNSGTGVFSLSNVPNSSLTNSSITINGSSVSLGGSTTIATASAATPTTLGTVYGKMTTSGASPYLTALGYNAAPSASGAHNTAVGWLSAYSITSGDRNVAVGNYALNGLQTGVYNTAIGFAALYTNTGSSNTAVGKDALYLNTSGAANVGVGVSALYSNTTAGNNTAMGYQALYSNTTAFSNTAIGYQALYSNTTAGDNTAVGYGALYSNTTGRVHTAVGENALRSNTTGVYNSAFGFQALYNNTTGQDNTAIGYGALYSNTTGQRNTAVGESAGNSITTGTLNTAVGFAALANNVGDSNTALGEFAIGYASSSTHTNNVGIGVRCGWNLTSGSYNVIMGNAALQNGTTAANSVAIGFEALKNVTTGVQNVAVGTSAGTGVTTGADNVFVGPGAGTFTTATTTGAYNVVVGGYSRCSAATTSNEIVIGYNAAGKGAGTGFISPSGGGVYQGNNSSSWSTTSDQRLKKNIVDNTEGLNKISQIRVRNFEYRTEEEVTELPAHTVIDKQGIQLGVIAQELQQVCPDCVKEESTGVLSVDSDNVFWHMVNAIKDLKAIVDAQAARIAILEGT